MEDEDEIFLAWKAFVGDSFEFKEIVLKGSTFEHHLFMKKDRLAHGTIL